jgi:DNA repair ATPase RecN
MDKRDKLEQRKQRLMELKDIVDDIQSVKVTYSDGNTHHFHNNALLARFREELPILEAMKQAQYKAIEEQCSNLDEKIEKLNKIINEVNKMLEKIHTDNAEFF